MSEDILSQVNVWGKVAPLKFWCVVRHLQFSHGLVKTEPGPQREPEVSEWCSLLSKFFSSICVFLHVCTAWRSPNCTYTQEFTRQEVFEVSVAVWFSISY